MKIEKIRIKNYKSIIDSGDCYLTDNITIFAGKNESGKTSILEALEDFDTDKKIREESKPIRNKEAIPQIEITFKISKTTVKEIADELDWDDTINGPITLNITKTYPDYYSISDDSLDSMGMWNSLAEELKEKIEKSWKKIKEIYAKYPQLGGAIFDVVFDNTSNLKNLFSQFKEQTKPNINNISDEKERINFSTILEEITNDFSELENLSTIKQSLLDLLKKKYIPNFILFNSFDDIFPNKILIKDLETNNWIKDVAIISDLEPETIKGTDEREKHMHKKDVNITFNKDYGKFWTQDMSNLRIEWDSTHLYFWIEEDDYLYEPSLRSKGRQWHLAFYIKVSARAHEKLPNIILIDEPGLFLHAQAQKDILGKLEDSAKETQLIFATHSPYLLEPDKLNRIRLIHRTKKGGTKIENKLHVLADKETLTPILTAIGLELIAGIANLDKIDNIVVEGPSDSYYLEAFKRIFKKTGYNFIYGGGSGNMPFVGTILHGWGCKVLYLYDNDQGKKNGEKNLKNNWLVSQDLILSVLEKEGSIEDVFSQDDFKKYILKNSSITYNTSNSEYIKDNKNKVDKVLSAKLFLESVETEQIQLTPTTINNVSKLFEKIESKF
jgi:predicted ATP-dependent endonuclease of OLD family